MKGEEKKSNHSDEQVAIAFLLGVVTVLVPFLAYVIFV